MWTDDGTAFDILKAARLARDFSAGLTRPQFEADLKTQSAVLHQIIILGEAVKRLSMEFRQAHLAVPWDKIAGMRDRCVHGYDNVDDPWMKEADSAPWHILHVSVVSQTFCIFCLQGRRHVVRCQG
jgi:uncharacterized protein with HEPN domain